jgi:hypothetical protein
MIVKKRKKGKCTKKTTLDVGRDSQTKFANVRLRG